jgi:DNA-binding response OmpR family regulator
VTVAIDGRQAIEAFAAAQPDLVLLDLMLPDIDGVEVCREMRRIEAAQERERAPVLMLTALTSQHDRDAGYEAGADDYLAKPFGITELLDRVATLAPDS